jgi:hypothetical protein
MSDIIIIRKGIMISCFVIIALICVNIIEDDYDETFGWYPLTVSASAQETSKVTIIITDPPQPLSKQVTTNEDESLIIKLEANDPDSDSLDLDYQIVDNPKHGDLSSDEITGNPFADINYIPKPDFYGEDSFTFMVSDESDQSENLGTVTIMVNPVNDIPTAEDSDINGTISCNEGMDILLEGADLDGDSLKFTILDLLNEPQNGILKNLIVVDENTARVTYEPIYEKYEPISEESNTIIDTFKFSVSDGNNTNQDEKNIIDQKISQTDVIGTIDLTIQCTEIKIPEIKIKITTQKNRESHEFIAGEDIELLLKEGEKSVKIEFILPDQCKLLNGHTANRDSTVSPFLKKPIYGDLIKYDDNKFDYIVKTENIKEVLNYELNFLDDCINTSEKKNEY